jgi:hypothetical protein
LHLFTISMSFFPLQSSFLSPFHQNCSHQSHQLLHSATFRDHSPHLAQWFSSVWHHFICLSFPIFLSSGCWRPPSWVLGLLLSTASWCFCPIKYCVYIVILMWVWFSRALCSLWTPRFPWQLQWTCT